MNILEKDNQSIKMQSQTERLNDVGSARGESRDLAKIEFAKLTFLPHPTPLLNPPYFPGSDPIKSAVCPSSFSSA